MRSVHSVYPLLFWLFLGSAVGLFYLGELNPGGRLAMTPEIRDTIRGVALIAAMVSLVKFARHRHWTRATLASAKVEAAGPLVVPVMAALPDWEPSESAETAAAPSNKSALSLSRVLAVMAVAAALIYMGDFAYAAVTVIVGVPFFAFRKDKNVVQKRPPSLKVRVPGIKKSDEQILKDIQKRVSHDGAAETSAAKHSK